MPVDMLSFDNAGPFSEVSFEFDPDVNVLVGPNNSGKSTALAILGELCVYPFGVPPKLLHTGQSTHFEMIAGNGKRSKLKGVIPVPKDLLDEIALMLSRIGFSVFIPAIRTSTDYRSRGPTRSSREDAEHWTTSSNTNREVTFRSSSISIGGNSPASDSSIITKEHPEFIKRDKIAKTFPNIIQDATIIQRIVELDYKGYRTQDDSMRVIIERIATMLSEITQGFPVSFISVEEDDDGLYPAFKTPDGILPFNYLSQGTQSLLQWLSYLVLGYAEYHDYRKGHESAPGVLIVDDIDAHLHPSWQRRIITTIKNHYPKLQLFVSTHSPLMLAGLKPGQVHLLRRERRGTVSLSRNESDIVGWSSDEILAGFLDLEDPVDLGTAQMLERLRKLASKQRLSAKERSELNQLRETVGHTLEHR